MDFLRKKAWWWLLFLLLLSACNPKPVIEEENQEKGKRVEVEGHERVAELALPLPEEMPYPQYRIVFGTALLAAFEGRMTDADTVEALFKHEQPAYLSFIDWLEELDQQDFYIIPTFGDVDLIQQELEQGRLVFGKYHLTGRIEHTSIFYAYTDDRLFVYDLLTRKNREIPIDRFRQAFEQQPPELFVYRLRADQVNQEREASRLYFRHAAVDVFYKRELDAYAAYIERMEAEDLIEEEPYFYAFYYIFIDPQPIRVTEVIEHLLELNSQLWFYVELAFMHHLMLDELEEADRLLDLLDPQYMQEETLYSMGQRYLALGRDEQARYVLGLLHERNPNFPDLEQLLREVEE